MRDTEQLKRLLSEAFSFNDGLLTTDRTLYIGLLSYDRSQLLSPHPLVPSLFKAELDPDRSIGIEKQALSTVSRFLGVHALTSVAALHIPEQPAVRGYLIGAASPRVSSDSIESINAFSHEDIRASLDVFHDAGLENTPERQFLHLLGQAGCRYIVR